MSDQQPTPASAGWGTIGLVYLLCVIAASCISQAVPIAGDIARHFHLARPQVGWVISIPSALVAVGALLTGWLVDRVGDRPLILLGCAVLVLGDIGVTLAGSFNGLLLMRILEGVGYDFVAVSTVTMIARVTHGPKRTTALVLWSSYIPMSFAIPLILAGLLAGTEHWRWAFSGHAVIMFVLGCAAFGLPAREQGSVAARSAGLLAVLKTPACYALGAAFACAAFVQTGIVSTLPQMLMGRYGVSTELASSVGTLGMFSNIAGCLLMGRLLNRGLAPLTLACCSVLLTIAAGLGLYAATYPFALAVSLALLYFLGSGLVVGLWALLPSVAPTPASRGATSGLVTQLTLWGVLFGPPAAFAAQSAGAHRQMLNIAVAMLLCLLLLWMPGRRAAARVGVALPVAGH
jgi:MFS transporter, DHA1 family, inner membrane transport protein